MNTDFRYGLHDEPTWKLVKKLMESKTQVDEWNKEIEEIIHVLRKRNYFYRAGINDPLMTSISTSRHECAYSHPKIENLIKGLNKKDEDNTK